MCIIVIIILKYLRNLFNCYDIYFFFDLCGLFIYKGFLCRKKIIYCNLIIFLFLIDIGKIVLECKFCLF